VQISGAKDLASSILLTKLLRRLRKQQEVPPFGQTFFALYQGTTSVVP
jgi:hypothetical protein